MGSDWNKPKKPYVIESMREPDPDSQFLIFSKGWDWKTHSKYSTKNGRDQELKTLMKKSENSPYYYFKLLKFRKGNP
jgi:CCR4-NOT transcriptional regulation complex NOT5 subunit